MRLLLEDRRIASALLATALLSSTGCGAPAAPPAASGQSYAMRGEIVRLPAAGAREIILRHEAVPDLRDESGKVVGMEAMTMPFTLARDVGLEGLAPGDRIAFTLEMRWQDPREIARISRIEKLPAGTTLSWEAP